MFGRVVVKQIQEKWEILKALLQSLKTTEMYNERFQSPTCCRTLCALAAAMIHVRRLQKISLLTWLITISSFEVTGKCPQTFDRQMFLIKTINCKSDKAKTSICNFVPAKYV